MVLIRCWVLVLRELVRCGVMVMFGSWRSLELVGSGFGLVMLRIVLS